MARYSIEFAQVDVPSNSDGGSFTVEEDKQGNGNIDITETITFVDSETLYNTGDVFDGTGQVRLSFTLNDNGPYSVEVYTPIEVTLGAKQEIGIPVSNHPGQTINPTISGQPGGWVAPNPASHQAVTFLPEIAPGAGGGGSSSSDSTYVFESGEPFDVGSHGDHDYFYSSGSPVVDDGESPYVFESGTGIRTAGGRGSHPYNCVMAMGGPPTFYRAWTPGMHNLEDYVLIDTYELHFSSSVYLDSTGCTLQLFSASGDKLYVGLSATDGNNNDEFHQYTLDSPYDVKNKTYDGELTRTSPTGSYPFGMIFPPDGERVIVATTGPTISDVYYEEYDLTTPWDITDASKIITLEGGGGEISDNDTGNLLFTPDGKRMVECQPGSARKERGAEIRQFRLSTAFTLEGMTTDVRWDTKNLPSFGTGDEYKYASYEAAYSHNGKRIHVVRHYDSINDDPVNNTTFLEGWTLETPYHLGGEKRLYYRYEKKSDVGQLIRGVAWHDEVHY